MTTTSLHNITERACKVENVTFKRITNIAVIFYSFNKELFRLWSCYIKRVNKRGTNKLVCSTQTASFASDVESQAIKQHYVILLHETCHNLPDFHSKIKHPYRQTIILNMPPTASCFWGLPRTPARSLTAKQNNPDINVPNKQHRIAFSNRLHVWSVWNENVWRSS